MSVHVSADGAVGTLTLDAPPLNLLSDALRAALLDALADFRARRLRAVILTGRGRAFCAGADLRDEAKLTAEQVQAFLDADEAVFGALAEFPGAAIAAVRPSCGKSARSSSWPAPMTASATTSVRSLIARPLRPSSVGWRRRSSSSSSAPIVATAALWSGSSGSAIHRIPTRQSRSSHALSTTASRTSCTGSRSTIPR